MVGWGISGGGEAWRVALRLRDMGDEMGKKGREEGRVCGIVGRKLQRMERM